MNQLGLNLDIRQGFLFALAIALASTALAVASLGALRQPTPGFTQLWILPGKGADVNTVQLGVSNMEATALTYKVELKIGEKVVDDWASIELQPGEKWTTQYLLPEAQANGEMVEAILYRLDSPGKIYRRVTLWRN